MTRSLSIRWRLTLWYSVATTVVLVIFSAAVVVLSVQQQSARIDFELEEEMDEIAHKVSTVTDLNVLMQELQAEFGFHRAYEFDISRRDGSAMFLSSRLGEQRLFDGTAWPSQPTFGTQTLAGWREHRVLRKVLESPHGELLAHVAIPLAQMRASLNSLLATMGLVGPPMLLAIMVGGYWLARRTLAPMDHITQTAQRITAQRLDHRLDVPTVRDELSRLAETLNGMIDRLHRSFDEMRRFTADAAHELRTPLTVLRTQLDVALRAERSPAEYRSVLVSLHEETVRLCRLASQLLELSQEDAGIATVPFTTVRLDDVLRDAITQVRPAADAKSLKLDLTAASESEVMGDAQRLQRVFINILDNAVKHTPPEGCIQATVSSANGSVRVEITDTGCGIPPEHLPHIFERFYRADSARSSPDGAGLGLAICRSIIQAHHGQIDVRSQPEQGTVVTVTLPTDSDDS